VRELPLRELHGLAFGLRRRAMAEGLTERQEWLWEVCIGELEYRAGQTHVLRRCTCELCYLHPEPPPL